MIDASGQVVLKPGYDAIGDFKDFGYAVMQRQGKIGLLNREGKEIIAPRYEDLKVLDSTLIAVMDYGEWMVINLHGQVVLNKGYTRVQVWDGEYLAFLQNKKWGIVNKYGRLIAEPRYDEVYREDAFFVTRRGDMLGLLSPTGVEILTNAAAEIKILSDTLFFYRVGRLWGAVDHYGGPLIPPNTIVIRKYQTSLSSWWLTIPFTSIPSTAAVLSRMANTTIIILFLKNILLLNANASWGL
ncbi:MAG: WG repeat-containing protein [Saprospiraceae bacterium]|nr:WG repeat-containing protein [Saprospiraceae bacterium]